MGWWRWNIFFFPFEVFIYPPGVVNLSDARSGFFFFFAHTRAKNEIILIIIIASFFPSVLSASTLQFLLYSAFISSRPFSSTLNNMQWTVKTLPITDSDSFGQWKKAHFLWFHSVRCWCCRYGHLCVWAVSFQPRQRFTPMQLAIITIMTVEWR